jgi:serine/threonine-protein kinase
MADPQQRYRVIEKLESGGMAEVFRAESEGIQGFRKQVAIKRVLPHLSEKKRFISMFLDEARLSAHLNHSNCVQVFDIGVGDNAYFIVMEFVDGANLKTVIEWVKRQSKQFPVAAASFICHEICKGLSYAHELSDPNGAALNIVHRDMSPPNVLITKYGEVKIVDFGLAKATSQLEKSEPGIIKGKFSYLSPEAAMGQEVDLRTDVFAVGIILWELLSGQRLFLGETDFQTVKKVQQAVIPSISQINREVPPELERIVNRALARDPNSRYQTAREIGIDLSKFMFAFGVPCSTFDIAQLVRGAMREQKKARPQQVSIIDKLIEEALLEFTSLTEDGKSQNTGLNRITSAGRSGASGAEPLLPDFVDPTNWAKEISITESPSARRHDPLRASLPPEVFDVGNLAALEDDVPSSGSALGSSQAAPGSRPSPVVPMPAASTHALSGPASAGGAALAAAPSGAGKTIGVVVALFAFLVMAVVAYFMGIIPHG